MKITFYLAVKGAYSAIYMSIRMPDSKRLQVKIPNMTASREDWLEGRFKTGKGKSANAQKQDKLDTCKRDTLTFVDSFYRKNAFYPTKVEIERFLMHGNHSKTTNPVTRIKKAPKSILPEISKVVSEFESGKTLSSSRRMTLATVQGYIQMYMVLENFQHEKNTILTAKSITEESTIRAIEEYLTNKKKMKLNTVGKRLRNLRSMLNILTRRGLIDKNPFTTFGIKTPKEEVYSIALTRDELIELEQLELDNKSLEHVRDHFLCMCYTGLRVSDYRVFASMKLYQPVVEVTAIKTKEKCYIPVLDPLQRIIKKYNGILPPVYSSQKMAQNIKKVCSMLPSLCEIHSRVYTRGGRSVVETVPKYQMVSNHTARRTFVTMMHRMNIPEEAIMSVTGHRDTRSIRMYNKMQRSESAMKLFNELSGKFT